MKTDNKTKTLETDSNADLIFKKGDYVHTYIVIETSGLPNGATLYLLDENLNQLYSPYDVNANQVKTPCTIIVGETDALQLPANYVENEYTDFDVGTYNWKLKYHDGTGKTFEDKIIPITIKIQDFDIETNLTPEIYPNEDIQIQLKTWVNTVSNEFDIDRLTTNADYNSTTGIITYPNTDIDDLSLGQHTQMVNQYKIDYTIKNPIFAMIGSSAFSNNKASFSYEENIWFGVSVSDYSKVGQIGSGTSQWYLGYIKGLNVNKYVGWTHGSAHARATSKERYGTIILAPGHYLWTTEFKTANCQNEFYYDEKAFEITTENCEIILEQPFNNIGILKAKYTYNNSINIPNATLDLLDRTTSTLIETKITDSNGECQWEIDKKHYYQIIALDYDETYLLRSNIVTVSDIWKLIIFDSGILNDNDSKPNNWRNYNNRLIVNRNVNGITLEGNSNYVGYYFIAPYGNDVSSSASGYNYFDKWYIEFDIESINLEDNYIALYLRDNVSSEKSISLAEFGIDDNFSGHVIFKYDGTSLYYKIGDNEIQSKPLSLDIARLGFKIGIGSTLNICFKNFKIYSEPKLILNVNESQDLIDIQLIDIATNGVAQKQIELYQDNTLLTTLTTDNNGKCNYTFPFAIEYSDITLQAKYGTIYSNIYEHITEPL